MPEGSDSDIKPEVNSPRKAVKEKASSLVSKLKRMRQSPEFNPRIVWERALRHNAQLEWHGNSFTVEEGDFIPQEPSKRERISPSEPPSRLKEDEDLGRGYEFLREFGNRINVHIRYARHEKPEDLGDSSFERQIRDTDIYLLEGLGWNKKLQQGLDFLAERGKFPNSNEEVHEFIQDPFHMRIARAIAGTQTRISFADVDGKAGDSLRQGILDQADYYDNIKGEGIKFIKPKQFIQ